VDCFGNAVMDFILANVWVYRRPARRPIVPVKRCYRKVPIGPAHLATFRRKIRSLTELVS
jgi:hypothetical protein